MKKGTLVLAGSGEFTPAMDEIDRTITTHVSRPVVAIIPTAAGQEDDWWKWVEMGISHYKALGIEAFGVPIRTGSDADNPDITAQLSRANIFYFSGGDPGYVLSVIRDSSAWRYMYGQYENGAVLAGSSAGAMMMGSYVLSNIYNVWDNGEKHLQWSRALSLVPHIIWPHFDFAMREFPRKIQQAIDESPEEAGKNWLGIDEDTAVIWKGSENPVVLGKGKSHWGKL